MNNIFTNLPDDVVIEKIIPFSYKFQDKSILADIRSFKKDFDLVDSIYAYSYKNVIFFNDLKRFIKTIDNNSMLNSMLVSKHRYSPFFQRHVMLKDKSIIGVATWQKYFYDSKLNVKSKIKIIWGLLTPVERTSFFNMFVLEDDE